MYLETQCTLVSERLSGLTTKSLRKNDPATRPMAEYPRYSAYKYAHLGSLHMASDAWKV